MNPIRWPPSCRLLHRPLPDHMRFIVGLLAVATLAIASGCAKQDWIDRTLVTADVPGTWRGTTENADFELVLEQQGPRVNGSMRIGGPKNLGNTISGPIDGTVSGDVFRFRDSRGQLEGEVTVSGDEMDGRVSFMGSRRPIVLRRADPSSPPGSPPR
jgi:hypothetical protein